MSIATRVFNSLFCALVLTVSAHGDDSDDKLKINGPLQPGIDVVRGIAKNSETVTIMVNLKPASQCRPLDGKFAAALDNPLKAGDLVEARQKLKSGDLIESEPLTVGTAPAVVSPADTSNQDTVRLVQPRESDSSVSGTYTGTRIAIIVEVLQGDQLLQTVDATVDETKHRFTAALSPALTEDETVHAHSSDSQGPVADDYATVASLGYDWGRVRVYFSLGAEWARSANAAMVANAGTAAANNNSAIGTFGSPNAFVGMNVDYNWWNSRSRQRCITLSAKELADDAFLQRLFVRQSQIENARNRIRQLGSVSVDSGRCESKPHTSVLVNTYFDARLTEIPISSPPATMPAASTPTPDTTTQAATVNPGQFQGGYFEGGVYAPIVPSWAQWSFQGQSNGIFLAPMAKLGFQAGDVSVSSSDPEKFDVFRFYGFGARIGHFKLFNQAQSKAPQLLSYIDITGGRWDNFRIYPSAIPGHLYQRPWRFDAIGRFKIPLTPLYIGGEVNVGPGADDLRIFMGTRIDIGKVVSTLIPALK